MGDIDTSGNTAAATPPPADPYAGELREHGVPDAARGVFGAHGVGSLVRKLGIVFTEMGVDRVCATMPVEGNQQVAGILHGGASAALAETLGSVAAGVFAAGLDGDPVMPVGVDLNATHHRPGISGLVHGVCTPIKLGRRATSHEIVISDDAGERVCTARITNMLVPRPTGR
ncbi:hotdog fold thioesterase [Zafaria sp. Z1313]|uniref:hotdog fold thioesterase n=1 Tax=unclassified Zafaria TaxID=2828765 RepID=UPI002E76EFC9|nr:hotdog fold thioesterase [Zafaria sp. J156]MEE1620170.1 hotdog fold thioesterase [Zafaria sp. J156]